ncbi:hypothetical protein FF36_03579 [Frankia torreyi]|uniref:DUF3592 domain-containing protein n=1 Tax=Frankia torreyi TaxID=1856 RepID=A0A0D8BFD4_9ACTN|nr:MULTISPECIES: hypothetical protein [Frankia]KJE22147.1 hypothetical protein FF36_03579 [Frankia torreyi]KQC38104.1 hypothetical protein UK82_12365 [Frankia sp. ACN1ag]
MTQYGGTVSGFAPRVEGPVIRKRSTIVWSFRIERPGQRRIAVEMRAKYYSGGSINNGDTVELTGSQRRNGVVRVTEVKNLTAGTMVRAHQYNALPIILNIIALMIFIAIVAIFGAFFLSNSSGFASP